MSVEKSPAVCEIERYAQKMKYRFPSLHFRMAVNDEAAGLFIRWPTCESEWIWTVFESVRELCVQFPMCVPFTNVEDFPDIDLEALEGYKAKYFGLDLSHYQYPDRYPGYINHFALLSNREKATGA